MSYNSNKTNGIVIAITAASYSGNKGAAAMLQSSIVQLHEIYGDRLGINLMSVYPAEDRIQCPHSFVRIVSCKPAELVFIAFPLSILYYLFRWCGPFRWIIGHNHIIRAYEGTDLVIDEAGISFVDSRGFVMNMYAFICVAVPLLCGIPVVKYSQAIGPFKSPINRLLAKHVLPKIELICARGKITEQNLAEIGITTNVKPCADGAFTMRDDPRICEAILEEVSLDPIYLSDVVGLSISSVVYKRCKKQGIDYISIMVDFVDWLVSLGYSVHIIANAAREGASDLHNNDLPIGDWIYNRISDAKHVKWDRREMTAEEIREYISHCRFLVASRFHSMIGALEKRVPAFLIGWSHKYLEVMDMFGVGDYAIDYEMLDAVELKNVFNRLVHNEQNIKALINNNYDTVINSSYDNIRLISGIIDSI